MSPPDERIIELDMTRRADRDRFVGLPFELSRAHPAWHPGLRTLASDLVDPGKNPFWNERSGSFFVALRGGRVVGRLGSIPPGGIPQRPRAATIVMPDFIEDPGVFSALLGVVEERAHRQGADELLGPLNPSIHHDIGVQIDGFERRNAVFMGYQPPYYSRFFEAYGFRGMMDVEGWALEKDGFLRDGPVASLAGRVERNPRFGIRDADPKRFDEELVHFHRLYSESFADHWGFVAPTWEEFTFIAGDIRRVLRPGMAMIAEWDGAPVGFVLSVPDLHTILPRQREGRLTPISIAKTLLRWRRMDEVRVMIAGVLPAYRRYGIHFSLFHRSASNIFALGFRGGEISWVLSDNQPMQRVLPLLGARRVKAYRLYARTITR